MGFFKKMRIPAAVIAVAVVLASICYGCGLFKPTAASLTAKMLKKVSDVKSAEAVVNIDSDLQVKLKSIEVGTDLHLNAVSDIEMTREPQRTKSDTTASFTGIGQLLDLKIELEQYTEKTEDGATITYERTDGGQWKKTIGEKQESEGTAVEGNPALGLFGMIREAGDNLKDAKLKEETTTVNGKEAYEIDVILNGALVKEVIGKADLKLYKAGIDVDSIDWDSVSIPTQLYIYKDSSLPARVKLECTELGSLFLGSLLEKEIQGTMMDGVDMEFRSFTVDASFDRYNEIEEIEIPREALEAQ